MKMILTAIEGMWIVGNIKTIIVEICGRIETNAMALML